MEVNFRLQQLNKRNQKVAGSEGENIEVARIKYMFSVGDYLFLPSLAGRLAGSITAVVTHACTSVFAFFFFLSFVLLSVLLIWNC